jgi:hypothetical protein
MKRHGLNTKRIGEFHGCLKNLIFALLLFFQGKPVQPSTASLVTATRQSPLNRIASGIESALNDYFHAEDDISSTKGSANFSDHILEEVSYNTSDFRTPRPKSCRALKFDDNDEESGSGSEDGHNRLGELNENVGALHESRVAKRDVPSRVDQARFRRSFDSAASLVFHQRTGLPLTSSPAPCRRGGGSDFGFDSSLTSVHAIKRY